MNFIIKVADFGLSENIGKKEYFRQDKDDMIKLPLKWSAPENIDDYMFSEKSDVVNIHFGVLVAARASKVEESVELCQATPVYKHCL